MGPRMEEEASTPALTAQKLSSANSASRAVDAQADRSAVALQLAAKILANRREVLSDNQRIELLRLSNQPDMSTAKLTLRLCDVLLNKEGEGASKGEPLSEDEGGSDGGIEESDVRAGHDAAGRGEVEVGGGRGRWRRRLFLCVLVAAAAAAVQRGRKRDDWRRRVEAMWPVLVGWAADGWEWFWEGICEGARFRFFEGLFCLALAQVVCRLPRSGAVLLEWMLE